MTVPANETDPIGLFIKTNNEVESAAKQIFLKNDNQNLKIMWNL